MRVLAQGFTDDWLLRVVATVSVARSATTLGMLLPLSMLL
ncbi:uncharacterized protein METZ01_LOCUS163109 [marine metagenome]|uniref:Uncharacterized protein n=1 Tax=marine metagenome TaxID=408172 RepID=A0A382B8Y8_9ZZZZ